MENYKELVAEYQIKIRDKSLTPTERMNAIIKLQRYSMFIDYVSTIQYARLGVKYAKRIKDIQAEYISSTNEAICLYEMKEFKKSLKILLNNRTHFEKEGNEESLNFILFNLGNIYNDLDESEKAIRFFNESLAYFQKRKNYRNVILLYQNLSSCYLKLLQFDIAHKLCLNSIKLLDKHDIVSSEFFYACMYNNIAICKIAQKELDLAIDYANKAITLYDQSDSQQYLILAYLTLLDAYIVQKNESKVEEVSKTIYNLSKENHSYHLEILYKKLYEFYLKKNNYKEAIIYFEKFHQESVRIHSLNTKEDILNDTSDVFSNIAHLGRHKPANSVRNIFDSNYCIFIDGTNETIQKINISHISYVEFRQGITYIHTMKSEKYSTTESFKSIESKINQIKTQDHIFFSIFDRTCMVNLFWIDNFDYKNKRLTLDVLGEKSTLNVSVLRSRELKKLLLGKKN